MTEYQFIVKARAQRRIRLFYQNVARKYKLNYDMNLSLYHPRSNTPSSAAFTE